MKLVLEDFTIGHFGTFGPYYVSREDIIEFAEEFDPQPMHLDEAAAKHSLLRGLAGSGWHLCSIMMRMMCDGFLLRTACLGSPGVKELKWLAPLRPTDSVVLDVEITGSRVSSSKPDRGYVQLSNRLRNGNGITLLTSQSAMIVRRRSASVEAS